MASMSLNLSCYEQLFQMKIKCRINKIQDSGNKIIIINELHQNISLLPFFFLVNAHADAMMERSATLSFNPFAPWELCKKRILKLFKQFSGHCLAIES